MTEPTRHDPLSATEPEYDTIAKEVDGLGEIRARLERAQAEASKTLVRALFLCGVFGRTFPEHAEGAGRLLLPHLENPDRRVRVGVGAAAVEIGRNREGEAFRDDILTRLLRTPGGALPDDPDVVRGWVLNALHDNKIELTPELRSAVGELDTGDPSNPIQNKARGLLAAGPSSKSGA
jgi:hypothetical protein